MRLTSSELARMTSDFNAVHPPGNCPRTCRVRIPSPADSGGCDTRPGGVPAHDADVSDGCQEDIRDDVQRVSRAAFASGIPRAALAISRGGDGAGAEGKAL